MWFLIEILFAVLILIFEVILPAILYIAGIVSLLIEFVYTRLKALITKESPEAIKMKRFSQIRTRLKSKADKCRSLKEKTHNKLFKRDKF